MSLFVLCIFLSLCASCLSCPKEEIPTELTSTPTKDNTFDTSQPNLNVAASSTFFLRLKSNPTTGYDWKMYSPSPLQTTACTYTHDDNPMQLIGRGGYETWQFCSGKQPGTYKIALQYRRPWQTTDAGSPTEFNVTVKDRQ